MACHYKSMAIFLFLPLLISSISSVQSINTGGFTVDLIHRDSPLSPSYDPSKTCFQHLNSAFERSFSRKSSLMPTSSNSAQSIQASITPHGGEYLMKIKIGTPAVEQLGIADTGSDLTWTQCKPCRQCFNQPSPLFDPAKTKSYRPVSCQSQQCTSVGDTSCDTKSRCQYEVQYGDMSYSIGEVATETFTFGANVSFPNIVFGCGYSNGGTFSQTGTGIIGLGGGPTSIINQLESSINGKFSYCLTLSDSNASSKISFGSNAVVTGPNVVSTPLIKKSSDIYYFLTLEGISVGSDRFVPNTTAVPEDGNIIIDSGTTLTFVPSGFYDGLESALVKAINATRASDAQGSLKLCYQLPSEGVGGFRVPPITAHFKGADLVLPQANTFVEVEKGLVCLTLLPTESLGIFGNLNQMNFHVGYDLVKQQLNFLPTDCTKN